MWNILFSATAKNQFEKLDKQLQKRIISTLERIRIRPEAYLKKLVGDPAYSLRVGDYRIIIDLIKDKLIILILRVGHRKNIYENL